MRHQKTTKKLDRNSAGRRALLRTQAISLFTYGKIATTEAKAKFLKPQCEKMITQALKGDLAARRLLLKKLDNEKAVKQLMEEVAPRFKDRKGGYTRIVRLDRRAGDAAQRVQLEII